MSEDNNNTLDFEIKNLKSKIQKAAYAVLQEIGTDELEAVYENCLRIELNNLGLNFIRNEYIPYYYKGVRLDNVVYAPSLIVENLIMVRFKGAFEEGLTSDKTAAIKNHMASFSVTEAVFLDFYSSNKNDMMHEISAFS